MEDKAKSNGRKIVCIDDEPPMVELIKFMLEKNGFEGHGALSGPDGLELIASEHPDLVLLDLMMPEMDGWDVFKRMKSDEAMQHIPVIVVTAKSQQIDIVMGKHIAKVDDYITKPFTPDELIESINHVLGISPLKPN